MKQQRIGYFPEQKPTPARQAVQMQKSKPTTQSSVSMQQSGFLSSSFTTEQTIPPTQSPDRRRRTDRNAETQTQFTCSINPIPQQNDPNNHNGVLPQTSRTRNPEKSPTSSADFPAYPTPQTSFLTHAPENKPRFTPTPQVSSTSSAKPKKKKKTISFARLAALLVCIVVFCSCLFLLTRYAYNIVISRRASAQLEHVYLSAQQSASESTITPASSPVPSPTPSVIKVSQPALVPTTAPVTAADLWPTTYANNPTLRISSVFYQLRGQNQDIVGWLKIDGVVEEAVVQRDNQFYLTHNALKQKSVTGALFLDESCDLETVPTQMVIHGHNMKEGAMFGSLKKYKVKDASYYRAHPFIDFNTLYENGRYVIFSVAEVDIRSSKPDYLPFWQYSRFTNAETFMTYVERAQLLSQYRCNVDVLPGDRLLTLSTCTGTDDNKRLIVMARKLRDNENEFELNMRILSTADR